MKAFSPPPAGYRRVAWLGLAGVLIALAGLLTPIPHQNRTTGAIGDLAHAPLFGCLLAGTLLVLDRLQPQPGVTIVHRLLGRIVPAALFWIAAGVGIEWLQSQLGRTASWHDAIANTLGIAAASVAAVGLSHRPVPRWLRGCLMLATAALLFAGWSRPIRILHDIYTIHHAYPVLGDFENSVELSRWYKRDAVVSRGRLGVTRGRWSMRMAADADADVPGITLISMPADWSDMTAVRVDATLDGDGPDVPVELIARMISSRPLQKIEGVKTERAVLERSFPLIRGQTLEIELERSEFEAAGVDLSSMRFIDLLVHRPESTDKLSPTNTLDDPIVVYFDDLRVIRDRDAERP